MGFCMYMGGQLEAMMASPGGMCCWQIVDSSPHMAHAAHVSPRTSNLKQDTPTRVNMATGDPQGPTRAMLSLAEMERPRVAWFAATGPMKP